MGNWELIGQQIDKLEVVLRDAFVQEDDLKQMLRKRLDVRWDLIKKGDTYESRLYNLIEWFESEGKIKRFIIEVANCKSKNLNVQIFTEAYIDKLFEFDSDRLSAESLIELLTILKGIPDFMSVWGIGKKILPSNIEVDRAQEIQAFEQSELSSWFKCLTILKFLLEDYPTSKERPNIFIFVEHLSKSSLLEDVIKNQLKSWLQAIDPQQNATQTGLPSSFNQVSGELQAYLMIVLSPEKSKMLRSLATLHCVAPTGDVKEIPVNLDPQSKERGVLSTWKNVPQTVTKFIKQVISNELEKPANRLGCAYYTLTVELFLPHRYLNERVDQWEIEDSFGNLVPLIAEHRLVVRSQDRVEKPDLRNAFSKSWHRAKKILQENPQPASLRQNIEHLSELDCLRFGALQESLKEKIGIKITCSLPQSQKEMLKFLQAMLGSGIPLAVWVRDRELSSSELEQRFDQFLTFDLLCNPCNLIETVKKQRVSAFDDSENPQARWGRHLTILWDDFERMPVSEPLQSRGERSA